MATSLSEEKEASRITSAQEASPEKMEAVMKPVKICPRKILASLPHLRIDRARIKPIKSQVPKMGGKADVEAATLDSGQLSTSLEPEFTEYFAVKKLRFDADTDDDRVLGPFAHEVSLLADLYHRNVVKIVGFVEDTDNGIAWMVFSWEKNGNLREFIRSVDWELPERISLINDVARGLSYLHGRNPPICHGDLKSLNVLVNSENWAVITDFGSARAIDSSTKTTVYSVSNAETAKQQHRSLTGLPEAEPLKAVVAESGEFITMTGPACTVRWAAPELLDGALPSLGSDIWAFGWICWEAVTGNFPFDDESDVTVIQRIMTCNLPTLQDNAQFAQIRMLCSLMEDCLKLAVNERPAALKCQQILSFMNQTIPLRRSWVNWAVTRSSGLLCAIGWIQLQNGRAPKAQEYFERSLDSARCVRDELGQARALFSVGEAYRLQAENSKAEESYVQSRDLYSKIGNRLGFAQSVKALGDVYRVRNEYSKAEESYIESRGLYYKLGHQLGFTDSVKALGDVYRMRKDCSKAEESYIQSRDLYSKIGDQLGFAQSVKALGDVYRMRNEYSKAEESYFQSRNLYSKIGDQLGLAQSLEGLGRLHKARTEYANAAESYLEAQRIYHGIGDNYSSANIFWHLGWLHRAQAEYVEAERLVREASAVYGGLGLNQLVAKCDRFIDEIAPFIQPS